MYASSGTKPLPASQSERLPHKALIATHETSASPKSRTSSFCSSVSGSSSEKSSSGYSTPVTPPESPNQIPQWDDSAIDNVEADSTTPHLPYSSPGYDTANVFPFKLASTVEEISPAQRMAARKATLEIEFFAAFRFNLKKQMLIVKKECEANTILRKKKQPKKAAKAVRALEVHLMQFEEECVNLVADFLAKKKAEKYIAVELSQKYGHISQQYTLSATSTDQTSDPKGQPAIQQFHSLPRELAIYSVTG